MLRLITNIFTDTGNKVMEGAFWENTAWFWQTNWLVFECWLLVFIVLLMIVVSFFTKGPSKEQIDAITFTPEYRKQIASSWGVWDIIGTLGVLALCGTFYWYFF
jgi:SSS family solute:Na+ symporter